MIRTPIVTKLRIKYGSVECPECGTELELLTVTNVIAGKVKRPHCPECLPVEDGEDR